MCVPRLRVNAQRLNASSDGSFRVVCFRERATRIRPPRRPIGGSTRLDSTRGKHNKEVCARCPADDATVLSVRARMRCSVLCHSSWNNFTKVNELRISSNIQKFDACKELNFHVPPPRDGQVEVERRTSVFGSGAAENALDM